ncbi:MAG TPA: ion channel [Roseiarcus sp.]|nr:ion channel [Roseiarcus sp.]
MADRTLRQHLNAPLDRLRIAVNGRRARPRVARIGNRPVITQGLEANLWTDFYFNAMTVTWPRFIGWLAAIFVLINLVFAGIYSLGDAPVANAKPGSFSDLFFFSVETTSTVGYGDMHPQTMYGHLVATVENFAGLVLLAVMTGLVFARFSRPRARLVFAQNPVITRHNGLMTMMVRIANARNNFISNATAKLWVIRGERSTEGRQMTRFQPLRLERNENPVFALTWVLMHVIDEDSPLYGMSAADLAASDMNFVVGISGLDETSAQLVHDRHPYSAGSVKFGHEFVDVVSIDEDGMRRIDYAKLNETREAPV